MEVQQMEPDVTCVFGWGYGLTKEQCEESYKLFRVPKIPLLIASFNADQLKGWRTIIEADEWKQIGWYPSSHDTLERAYKVYLYAKIQGKAKPVAKREYFNKYISSFNGYVPLSCSCVSKGALDKPLQYPYGWGGQHHILYVHRHTEPIEVNSMNQWRKFAKTSLATYWFWGLAPFEEDRYKYEPKEKA